MKFGPETTAKLVEGMRLGMTAKLCCDYAGISESLFYKWRKQAKAGDTLKIELFQSLKRAEASGAAHCLATIRKAAQSGTWQAAAWLLERRHQYTREQAILLDTGELAEREAQTVDPSTAEGREAIIGQVSQLPEDMILAALNRAGSK